MLSHLPFHHMSPKKLISSNFFNFDKNVCNKSYYYLLQTFQNSKLFQLLFNLLIIIIYQHFKSRCPFAYLLLSMVFILSPKVKKTHCFTHSRAIHKQFNSIHLTWNLNCTNITGRIIWNTTHIIRKMTLYFYYLKRATLLH